jgi:class 3 adenylate cyclase/predicted ATPase
MALSAVAKFCHACAHPVAATTGAPSPETYTPRHLAEKILTSRGTLEGERKLVTVLFADLKGSMELLADRDPEEARKILDPVLERMMEAVHRYEGTVNQVMGDGIMALFGAPLAHEDHAMRACYAALRMQEAVKRYSEGARRAQGVSVRIRVGLNSGEVVVRAIGSDLRMDYTAVGQTTHLAARMEQLADPGSILLAPATLALAEGYIEVKSLGAMPVRGLTDAVEVYEMLGAAAAGSRFAVAAGRRGLTKFVGRMTEMEQLSRALEQAKASHGQIMAVVGEPGVGKSRLYYEFVHSHRMHDCLVMESASVSYGKATAYLPVIELLKKYFRVEGRDDARIIREKVTGRLLSLDRALEPFLTAFLWLLDVPVDDAQWERLDPPLRRQQTLEGVKQLVARESQVQPVVLLFEDLHWIDSETQVLLDALVDRLPSARILMLVNYRPEYQHGWGSKTYYRQLRIDPLPTANAYELLDALLGHDPTVQPLKRLLVQRTEGTPFFLEESVRTLAEMKALVGEPGAYRAVTPVETIEVPATVKAMLAARMDRLPSREKAVLQAASVIGTDVPLGLLQAIVEIPEDELQGQVGHLQVAEFLYETRFFPDVEYTFKHALTHEVAYGSLLQSRRRELHARIVEAMERLYADRLTEQAERLAHHAVRAELWEQATRYLEAAGTKAVKRSANAEAIAYFEQALDVVRRLPSTHQQMRGEMQLLLALGQALQAAKGFGASDAEVAYSRARELCEQVGEPSELCQALWGLWLQAVGRGRIEAGTRIAEELRAVAEPVGDPALLLEAHHAMWPTLLLRGEPEATQQHLDRGRALYDREQHRAHSFLYGGHDPGACCRAFEGVTAWLLGYPVSALASTHAALTLASELGHQYTVALVLYWAATTHQLRRDVGPTRELAEALVALSSDHGFQQWGAAGTILAGWAQAEKGAEQAGEETGIAQLRRGIGEYRALGTEAFVPYFFSLLAAAYLKDGQTAAGLDAVAEALAAAAATGQHVWDAELHRLKGELLLAQDPVNVSEGASAFRHAIEIARGQGARSWELRAATSLARLLRGQGRREAAREILAAIHDSFTEGFDTVDLREAEALLEELSAR